MTCPLDPKKYPVLQDDSCDVKVILGKDQHTSVRISLSFLYSLRMEEPKFNRATKDGMADGLFISNFNPRTSFSYSFFVLVFPDGAYCCYGMGGLAAWVDVCLFIWSLSNISDELKGFSSFFFFVFVFVFCVFVLDAQ